LPTLEPMDSGKHRTTHSLRTQLIVSIVTPVTIMLIVLTIAALVGAFRLTRTLIKERDAQLVYLAARQIAYYWYDSVTLLASVAANDAVREGDPQAKVEILQANITLSQRFDQVIITDPKGNLVASTADDNSIPLRGEPWMERSGRLRRPVLSGRLSDRQGRPLLCVSIPLFDNRGRMVGYVVGVWRLDGERLGRPIANISIGTAGRAYLLDADGTILVHPDNSLVGTVAHDDPGYLALTNNRGGAETIASGGNLQVVGYAKVPLRDLGSSVFADESWGNWYLVTSESMADILNPLRPYTPYMIVLSVLVILLPFLIIFTNSRRIAAPLQSLAGQAGRIASGEFDGNVATSRAPREVRVLEDSFNTMTEQLRRYRADIQNYVASVLNGQEQERKRIARDLHDETAQALIVLGRRIESLSEIDDREELEAEIELLRDQVDETLQEVRNFTSDLRPPLLAELGLPRTLQLLGDKMERGEPFSVDFEIVGEEAKLSDELELGLYRIAQECLNNVRRHAHAEHVQVVLSYLSKAVQLLVVDDGVGFEPSANVNELIKSGRLGLMGIYERARLFGGSAQIESRPGKGTRVLVELPIAQSYRPLNVVEHPR